MRRRFVPNVGVLIVCGVVAGVVFAGVVFPIVAISGLAAKSGAEAFDRLPGNLADPRPPQMSTVYAADGRTVLTTVYDENRKDVPLDAVAPVMRQAIVAAEDTRFFAHHGVDVKGAVRAFVANNQANGVSQGASTLTMQYVRQALKYTATTPQQLLDATRQDAGRKIREMHYALQLEKRLNKQQILERYLNISYFGHQAYGIHAAAQVYFNTTPANLTLAQAALLAGLVKSPTDYDPTTPDGLAKALQRRSYVLDQMVSLGYASRSDADAAKRATGPLTPHEPRQGCAEVQPNSAGFFCDFLLTWWRAQPQFGETPLDRENNLRWGGYSIITSLDLKAQTAAERNIAKRISTRNPYAVNLAAVEPGTGRVRAMATNRVFSLDQSHNGPNSDPAKAAAGTKGTWPNTTNPLIGGGDGQGYQAGSTFKIFTMIAALESGLKLSYEITATSPYKSKYVVESTSPSVCPDHIHWCPKNSNPTWMNGKRNMWTGFGRSVNTYFVPLEERVGALNAVNVAKSLGITFRGTDADYAQPGSAETWGAFTLGVSGTNPLELANAYASLAADGRYCEPTPIDGIRDVDGKQLDVGQPKCRQAVPVEVARAALDAARCPLGDQSAYGKCDGATAPEVHRLLGRPVAGKTGTTDETTATLVAVTPTLAIAGIAADPDFPSRNASGMHAQVNAAVAETLRDALAGVPPRGFTAPTRAMTGIDQVKSAPAAPAPGGGAPPPAPPAVPGRHKHG